MENIKLQKIAAEALSARESVPGYAYNFDELAKLKTILEHLNVALKETLEASSLFISIPAPSISPDGKLGGSGYVLQISEMKTSLTDIVRSLSDLGATLADELTNPLWVPKIPKEEQKDIKTVVKEQEKIENRSNDFTGETKEVETVSQEIKVPHPIEEEEVISFSLPMKTASQAIELNRTQRKIAQIYFYGTGEQLKLNDLALIQNIYDKSAIPANLGQRKASLERLAEYRKIKEAIQIFLNSTQGQHS